MRVALVSAPNFTVDKFQWVADGFRVAGHETTRCHDIAQVKAADASSDLIVFDQHGAGCNVGSLAELARDRKAVWVQWWRDLLTWDESKPLAEQDHIRTFGRFMRSIDLVLIKERHLIAPLEYLDIKAAYFDQACPADMPVCTHHERPEYDVLVVGSMSPVYRQRRQDARLLAERGYRVLWVGEGDGLPPGCEWHPFAHPTGELPALVSRAAVVLGVDIRSSTPGYTSDRSYLLGGMGACLIARVECLDYGPEWGYAELCRIAPQMIAASWAYEDSDALLECVKQAIASRDERERRGMAARARIMANHTYQRRAEQLVELAAVCTA